MLPGVKPTDRKVEIPMVVVVQFEGDKIASERIYWDQASVRTYVHQIVKDSHQGKPAYTPRQAAARISSGVNTC